MAPRGSKSAIPVFLFLGVVLIFLPVAALLCVCLQKRHRRRQSEDSRAGTADAVAGSIHRWSKSAPIEMGILEPPPSVAIRPIRGMSVGKRPLHYMQGALGAHETEFDKPRGPTTEIAAPSPTRIDDECRTHNLHVPHMEATSPAGGGPFSNPLPLHSPRYNLQSALGSEESPASVRTAGERKASWGDAPRVKSQKVSPQAFHGGEGPAVPDFEATYEYSAHAHQQLHREWI